MKLRLRWRLGLCLLGAALLPVRASAQEKPYFVTYDHHMEEPGNLEIAFIPLFATQRGGNDFLSHTVEIGYGLKGWWTAEVYLHGQTTWNESTLFTGYRWENRFRPLMREHWINPVIYVEFADITGADKSLREVVGFDAEADHAEPNAGTRHEREREIETKVILSSNFRGWNIAENFIAEKNLAEGPWEFGYAFGVSRPLALAASPEACVFCRENFVAGVEMYGGAGTAQQLTFSGTSHYLAPVLAWQIPNGTTLRISPSFGLTGTSHRFLLRFGVTYEIGRFGRRVRRLFNSSNEAEKGDSR